MIFESGVRVADTYNIRSFQSGLVSTVSIISWSDYLYNSSLYIRLDILQVVIFPFRGFDS